MKTICYFLAAVTICMFSSACTPESPDPPSVTSTAALESSQEDACDNAIVGAWELVSQTTVYPDSVVESDQSAFTSMTINSPTRWLYIRMYTETKGFISAGGGRHTTSGNERKVIRDFYSHFEGIEIGSESTFDCRIEDDLWYHSGNITDELGIEEVWRRID